MFEILILVVMVFTFVCAGLQFFPNLRPSGDFGKIFDFITNTWFVLGVFIACFALLFIFG